MAVKPTKPNSKQGHDEDLSQEQMTVGQLERGPGSLSICFCLLEAEDPTERRQLLAQVSQPGARSYALSPAPAVLNVIGKQEELTPSRRFHRNPLHGAQIEVQCFG